MSEGTIVYARSATDEGWGRNTLSAQVGICPGALPQSGLHHRG